MVTFEVARAGYINFHDSEVPLDDLEALRYPVGRFKRPSSVDAATRAAFIDTIANAPAEFRRLVAPLSAAQLDTPYRPGGWTVRQLIHHVPDSHMNGYVRCKLAVTEDEPAIKTYEEARWAELPEARTAPIALSLALLEALHARWAAFLRALPEGEFRKTFKHPDWGDVTLDATLALYAWHCGHHAAHIRNLVQRRAWT